MSNLLIICIVYFVVVTINMVLKIFDIVSLEKSRVAQGNKAFSNFVYYYEIIPYLVGALLLVLISSFNTYLPNPNTVWHIIVFTLLVAFFYFLVGLIAVFIISIVESKKVKQDMNDSQDN